MNQIIIDWFNSFLCFVFGCKSEAKNVTNIYDTWTMLPGTATEYVCKRCGLSQVVITEHLHLKVKA